jgi:hypothetical protein
VAVIGGPGVDASPLLSVVRGRFRPGVVLAASADGPDSSSIVPLLRDRPLVEGNATAYLCRGFTCQAPTTSPDGLAGQLGA